MDPGLRRGDGLEGVVLCIVISVQAHCCPGHLNHNDFLIVSGSMFATMGPSLRWGDGLEDCSSKNVAPAQAGVHRCKDRTADDQEIFFG